MSEAPFADRNVRRPFRVRPATLAAVSAGGVIGGLARYGLGLAFPARPGGFPATTFAINVSGSFLLALLLVLVLEVWPPRRYLRPFAAVGMIGTYTTFSTWMVDTDRLLAAGHYIAAAANLIGSLLGGVAAVGLGLACGRAVVARRRRVHDKLVDAEVDQADAGRVS